MESEAIREVLRVAKRMDDKLLANAYEGNVSVKRDGYLYITPSGKNKEWLTGDMIAVFDEKEKQVAGVYPPSSELKMHAAMYGLREDIGGVVHSHAPFLTAFAMCNMPFVSHAHAELLWDHKEVEVLPYGRPGSDSIYAGAGDILKKGKDIMLLANHGVLAVGKTAYDALNKLESVESAAKICVISRLIGKEDDLPADEVEFLLSL